MNVYVRGLNACLQRKADLHRYKRYLADNGHVVVATEKDADAVLLWTCAFRQDQHDNSLRVIDEYNVGQAKLIVCGCLPSINPQALANRHNGETFPWKEQDEGLARLFGQRKGVISDYDMPFMERCLPTDLETFRKKNPTVKVGYTDQFLKMYVSEGCDFKCSYCAERLAFPAYSSIPVETLVERCRDMIAQTGQKRLVLWADSLGDYGHDRGESLARLVDGLLALDPAVEVGLENIHPRHFLDQYDSLMELVRARRIFLVNMPIQSANDRVLKLMNRVYARRELEKLFAGLSDAGFANCETDIILGFPTETEEECQDTIDFVIRNRVRYTKVSGYLETPGMASVSIRPKVELGEIRRRVVEASRQISAAGLLCNFDNNDTCKERFEKELVELW